MEIRAFAEAVLFTADMDLKLASPAEFTDSLPGKGIGEVLAPGRPDWLPMRSDKAIPAAPTPRGLEDPRVRGQALHSFAHHELQALELMALALLRFPDAPRGFRRGLVKILTDEQRHFRMYQGRAEHWGVGLGDVGMGHFFWDTVAGLDTTADFLAALSLTYEQANLDFSVYWEEAFRAVDDTDSGVVLRRVYEDEIGHVRHGFAWFERLVLGADFEAYTKHLVFPLSPGRGKGPIFNRSGRERTGMSEAFIDEMEITNVSRGRPPRVFSFDPFVEERAAGRLPSASADYVRRDLATIPMFFAHREDVVIAPRPSLETLKRLHRLGVEIPQFVNERAALGDRLLGDDAPWGHGPAVIEWTKVEAVKLRRALTAAEPNRLWAADESVVASNRSEAEAFLGQRYIAKAPLSASGQHRVRLDQAGAAKWLEGYLAQGPVVIEPWYDRVLDLSVQLEVSDSGAKILGVTRFWTNAHGAYRGGVIGPWTAGIAPLVLRSLHGGGGRSDIKDALDAMGRVVGEAMHKRGFRGPAGIDAMVVKSPDGLRLLPVLEVNPRYTMGRAALQIHKSTGLRGGWFFLDDRAIERAGLEGRAQLIAAVEGTPGVAFTTEPRTAERILTLMSVAKNVEAARQAWVGLGLVWPEPA
jgi:uncharacterized ferritin-like protein (DUF455 family)